MPGALDLLVGVLELYTLGSESTDPPAKDAGPLAVGKGDAACADAAAAASTAPALATKVRACCG